MSSLYMQFEVTRESLADALLSLDHDELIEIVKEIDGLAADYDFTKKLMDYFTREIAKEDAHDAD